MKKRKSITLFILLLLIVAGASYVAAFGVGKTQTGSAKNIKLGLDLAGGVSITYQTKEDNPSKTDMDDTKYKLEMRVSQYSTESEVYTQGKNRITVDIPGVNDAETILNELGQPGTLEFVTFESVEDDPATTEDESAEQQRKVWLTGSDIKQAEAGVIQEDNQNKYVVSLTMTDEGKEKFAEATTENVGKTLYIYYDGEIVSAPTVNQALTEGKAEITGMEDYDEADQLASTIRIGSLKLELQEISSQVVGAKLGADAIDSSLVAGLIAFILVCAFMIFVYRVPGLAASIALILYVALNLLCLNMFNLTLTLPGIAGIILSIGMGVDANVIIYARIKEEIADGKSVKAAIKVGFHKAMAAIVDGNVTTFIAAVILMVKGSGPVKGFGQTLAIGVVVSMLTAVTVSKLLVTLIYEMGLKDSKYYGIQKKRRTLNFVGKRAMFFAISLALIIPCLVVAGVNKANDKGFFNYSLEFVGGTSTQAEFDKDYSRSEIDSKLSAAIADIIGDTNVQSQKVNNTNTIIFKTRVLTSDERAKIKETLINDYGAKEDSIETVLISASVSNEMKQDAVVAIILASVCMLLYIWFRFKNIYYASSMVLAVLHDVLLVIGFYAVSRTTVGNDFIACILTILGYSINAAIIICDRIRENLKIMDKKTDLKELINISITQTLTRTIYTNLCVAFSLIVLYLYCVSSVKAFALPLVVGVIGGTYSDICITGALFYMFASKKSKVKRKKA